MKKILLLGLLTSLVITFLPLTACATDKEQEVEDYNVDGSKTIVVYFSCTNNTKGIAEKIATTLGCEIWQIVPEEPYTSADLNYNNNESRANKEQNDNSVRPAINGTTDLNKYEVVYVGYPIWWGKLPKIMCTFFDTYDLSGKTIIPFCTSGSSGINTSVNEIKSFEPNATVINGKRFDSNVSLQTVSEWVKSVQPITNNVSNMKINISVNGRNLNATLTNNTSAEALYELLKNGDITVDMHDYGNFEKVGELPLELPRNDEQITTDACDLILYLGHRIVIYYDTNSWNFTRLGKIEGVTKEELKMILGKGNVIATFSISGASRIGEMKSDTDKSNTVYYRIDGTQAKESDKGILVSSNGKILRK